MSESDQQLVLVPLSPLSQLPQCVLQVLNVVILELEQKLDDILREMLLLILWVTNIALCLKCIIHP